MVEPLSPELALVDPELAERARAQLTDSREPMLRPAPVRQPLQPQSPPPPAAPTRPGATSAGRAKPPPRRRISGNTIAAAVAVAVALGGAAAAILARSDDGPSSSGGRAQLAAQPQRDGLPQTATSARDETGARRPPGVARTGIGHVLRRSLLRRRATGETLRSPRQASFRVPGAPKEPLDEIPLPVRARRLDAWLTSDRGPTGTNQHHWLYQHAWIVTGARFGWWHGAEALWLLIRVDRRVESRWGIGYRSEAAARRALAAVAARTK